MLIAKSDFNNQKLIDVYKKAYMEAKMTDKGAVLVLVELVKVYANVDRDRALLTLESVWRCKPSATRSQLLELCNRANDQLIMIRVSCPEGAPRLVVDHTTLTEGGITGEAIINATRRFVRVTEGLGGIDADNIL